MQTPRPHPDYSAHLFTWQRVNDCYYGQDILLRNVHQYFSCPVGLHLPELADNEAYAKAMEFLGNRVATNSGFNNAAKAYYSHAVFPSLVSYTIKGFMSLITEHDPVVQLPEALSYLQDNLGPVSDEEANESFDKSIQNRIYNEVLRTGRCPVMLDPQSTNKPAFIVYSATSVINWVVSNESENHGKLLEVVIEEHIANPKYSAVNSVLSRYVKRYLHLYLVNGVYTVSIYTENSETDGGWDEEVKTPSIRGRTLSYIPLVFIGSEDNTPDVDVAPLSSIAVCQVKYGELEALLAHSENHSGAPTFVLTGVAEDDVPKVTGAGVGIALPDYTSKAYYTTTDTSFMVSMRERQKEYLAQAQDQGASLLGSSKATSESGEALRLRQAASTATLKSIIANIGAGIETLLKMAAEWIGAKPSEVNYAPNQEFSTFALTANEQIAMVQSWQAGAISHSTLLTNFRKAGMLKPGETPEDEKETLKKLGEKFEAITEMSSTGISLDVGENLPKPNTFDNNIKKPRV